VLSVGLGPRLGSGFPPQATFARLRFTSGIVLVRIPCPKLTATFL
jgi:hypothetical protein